MSGAQREDVVTRGTYLTVEDRPAVRFERDFDRPAAAVWRALTEPEQARLWFPATLAIEPWIGGTVRFTGDPNVPDSEGTVLDHDPPRRLAFTWGGGELHLAVAPDGGGCRLVLTNVLAARDEAARNAAGWEVCLGELAKVVRGAGERGPHADGALDWRAAYAAYVASGMPSGAPVPLPPG